jgi:hypothetical protein
MDRVGALRTEARRVHASLPDVDGPDVEENSTNLIPGANEKHPVQRSGWIFLLRRGEELVGLAKHYAIDEKETARLRRSQ